MSLAPGTRLGAYEILSALGAGGMGEVYRGRDTRLDRTVAIKILPEALAADPQFRERFDREARAISQLSHPHICTLYDIGEQQGTAYLVMEHIEGETLADRLKKGALPLDEALTLAIQIADALSTAHRHGIVHRDLKPGNVMLTRTGAKLLDFGLAKTGESTTSAAGLSMLPTTPPNLTAQGTLLGTFQYMAPEQLEGRDADARTDIFAFGVVVYELVTGRRAFEGQSHASLIGAIMHSEPPPIRPLPTVEPARFDRILRKCLMKDPDRRWQSVADVAEELRWLLDAPEHSRLPVATARTRPWLIRVLAVAAAMMFIVLAAAVVATYVRFGNGVQPPQVRFDVPASFPIIPNSDPEIAVSPDGHRIALVLAREGRSQIFVRSLSDIAPHVIAGTDGASYPFWAPDGRAIGFFADGRLKRIDFDGGPPQVLAAASAGRGGTWNGNEIVFATLPQGPLLRIRATGGDPAPVTKVAPSQTGHTQPAFLPDGAHIVFRVNGSPDVAGLYVVALDGSSMHRLAPGSSPMFLAPDSLLFLRQNALYVQRFDSKRYALVGDAERLAESVAGFGASIGTLVYRGGSFIGQQLTWFDRGGRAQGTVGPPDANLLSVELSPDEMRVAAHRDDGSGNVDIWLIDVVRNAMTRLTSDAAADRFPLWAPDGSRVIFDSNRSGAVRLYEKAVDQSDSEHMLANAVVGNLAAASDWSRDGTFILYRTTAQQGLLPNLWAVPVTGDRKPFAWAPTPFDQFNGQFSPDTRWVAYASDESGRYEVYIQSFPKSGVKYRASINGGVEPRWRRDGRELFYVAPDGSIVALPVNARSAAQGLELGKPTTLFQGRPFGGFSNNVRLQYAVTRDGQRFLVNSTRPGDSSAATVVVNWQEELKQRVSTR